MNLPDTWTRIVELESQGEFSQMSSLIQQQLQSEEAKSFSIEEQKQLAWKIDWINRVKRDFSVTEEGMFDKCTAGYRDFTRDEFIRLVNHRTLDWRMIDGQKMFFGSSMRNLSVRFPEYDHRQISPKPDTFENQVWDFYEKAMSAAAASNSPYILPQKYRMEMTITVKPDVVPEGKLIKCWMPFPRDVPSQKDITFISSEPKLKELAPGNAWMRSAYFEQTAQKGEPTIFKMNYSYTAYARKFNIDAAKVQPYKKQSAEYKKFTAEKYPHVIYNSTIKDLAKQIVGDEKNPYLKARKIFDWISFNTKYSYAHEYSTMACIPDFVLDRRYGDCGQHGMTFISLCRVSGIPARWQSGWDLRPGGENLHDWTEILIEPYGWIPVDPDFGVWVTSQKKTLNNEQSKLLRDFYVGGMDNWRLIANNDHGVSLIPAKKSFRSDDVDFQRAELECDGQNLYFDKFSYDMTVTRE